MQEQIITHKISGRAVIGVDLDGVCSDYVEGFRPYAADYLGTTPDSLPDPTVYNLGKAGWGFKSTADYLEAHKLAVRQHMYADLPILPGATEALQELSEAGCYIRIVTHRLIFGGAHQIVVSDTAKWLDDNNIPYMSLCFTGLKEDIGAHLYIEDSPDNITALRNGGTKTFVYPQTYNTEFTTDRMDDWAHGAQLIRGYLEDIEQLPKN